MCMNVQQFWNEYMAFNVGWAASPSESSTGWMVGLSQDSHIHAVAVVCTAIILHKSIYREYATKWIIAGAACITFQVSN